MITCAECKARLHPENPSQPFYMRGRYLPPLCQSCPNFNPEEEAKPQVIEHIVRHSQMGAKEFDLLQQTALRIVHLEKKLAEHTEYKRKVPVKSGKTKGIKIE